MTRRRKKNTAPPPANSKSRPVSFRLDKTLVEHIDSISQKLGVSRNGIVSLVLREYVVERGDEEIERIVDKEAENATQVDLFG